MAGEAAANYRANLRDGTPGDPAGTRPRIVQEGHRIDESPVRRYRIRCACVPHQRSRRSHCVRTMPTSSPASPIHGVCPVLVTPFRADGAPDAAALRRVVEFAIAAGADAVVYPGVASEVEQLADAERDRLLDAVAAAVRGRVPMIVGASATDEEATLRHLTKAK